MLMRDAIGSVLRRRRQRLGMTLRELAAASRVSLPYLSEVERGRKEASSEILAAICEVLNLSPVQLLDEIRGEYLTPVLELRTVSEPVAVGHSADGVLLAA
jgi:transcriptional regulator with XRE-family HTH domain